VVEFQVQVIGDDARGRALGRATRPPRSREADSRET
jgi:hypothetical protein